MTERPGPDGPWHSQDNHPVRLEWGPVGAGFLVGYAAARTSAVIAVVVDVLSFTTCVSVAADVGTTVLPYRWGDQSAAAFASSRGAALAVPRSIAPRAGGISLSPRSIREAGAVGSLVLPSPNGATTALALADAGATVVAASLRNATAVGRWVAHRFRASAAPPALVLVPAGERWPDGSLRPAVEDAWGAGGVAAALLDSLGHQAGPLLLSPEVGLALAGFTSVRDRVDEALAMCSSGRELIEQGYAEDVAVAAELDSSTTVPVLTEGAFTSAGLA
ncbi:MAG: 2-phosphosulfolactate phosphatase [Intrasporangium sp.]|uniref:2-phosphosulfolactate phosphatase n=1 Tax=Intrasporangium sp. TaxID=1925024 RepID=UPI00264A1470|nr:2-phosphosulfolactate phosphatase [Intrasporangium sp.]MDN5795145.1 2-phosphosulfolactate phosphatase [Intrasporangium sp.]